MERKLSQKATRMRQRFTFSRNMQARDRAATMISSAAPSTPNSRPRSSTDPVSSQAAIAWDSHDAACHYDFTDEPGYFRPASPLLDRQHIEEDLEDDVTHACSLLIQSIDRGLPMWPSFETGIPCHRPRNSSLVRTSQPETREAQIPQKQDPDSGVALDFQSPPQYTRPSQNSFPSAAGGRFYGKRSSTEDELDRGRSRGQSFATEASTLRSRCSRSRSSSPSLFPYSPPQLETQWTYISDPPDHLLPGQDAFLGAEGMTWLRASLDIDRLEETNTSQNKPNPDPTPAPLPGPAPRRFYSTREAPSKKPLGSRDWSICDPNTNPKHGFYNNRSLRSLSITDEKEPQKFPLRELDGSDSSDDSDNQQTIYSVVIPSEDQEQPRHRRKRASQLFKRLAGLGIRRREDTVESRRISEAIEAMA